MFAVAPSAVSVEEQEYSDLREEQKQDSDLKPVLLWKEQSVIRPD